jgi:uroporphyrinogen decarboxylase
MRVPTAHQRITAAIGLREPDSVPVVPQITYATSQVTGISFHEAMHSAEKMADALVAGYKAIGYDGVYVGWESSFNLVAEAMGCALWVPPGGIPTVSERVVNDPSDVDKIRAADPERDGRLPLHLKAVELVRREVGKDTPLFRYVPGPLTLASLLRGQEKFLLDLIKSPGLVRGILKPATESSRRFAVAAVEHGADIVVVADPLASTSVISPRVFDEFAFRGISEVMAAISKAGGVPSLHICGATTPILERMAATGTRIIELDYLVDLKTAKKEIGRSVCIQGNMNPTGTLFGGRPEDVEREAKDCIMKASGGGGFILSSGCEVPLGTPLENVRAMVTAGRKYGRYHA